MCRFFLPVFLSTLLSAGPLFSADSRGVEVVIFEPLAADAPTGNAGLFAGVNEFVDDSLSTLQYAVHDAIELAYLFVNELKLIPPEHCYLLLAGQPTSPVVQQHLDELKRQGAKIRTATRNEVLETFLEVRDLGGGPSDLLVVAFSSHGFEEAGMPYLMPSDGRRRLLSETAVPLSNVERRMGESKAGHRLLLVDACQERVSARNIGAAGAGTPMSVASLDAFKTATGQAKLTSCSPGELSYEHPSLGGVGHGVFSYAFLQALRGDAPADAQQLVRFGSVTDHVVQRVTEWSKARGRQQTPWVSAAGPTRGLPLAVRADDLASLMATVRRFAVTSRFDTGLRTRLADRVSYADLSQEGDRVLVARTRDFVRGTLSDDLFVPYLQIILPPPLAMAPFDAATAKAHQQAWSKHLGQPVEITNSLGMALTLIPGGEFLRGSKLSAAEIHERFPGGQVEWYEREHPRHRVRLRRAYYLGTDEVTVGQFERFVTATGYQTTAEKEGKAWGWEDGEWKEVDGLTWRNPGFEQDSTHPVTCVSWEDATAFCQWLSAEEGRAYRLPSEAEWEFACRAGTETIFFWGDDPDSGEGYLNAADLSGTPDGRNWKYKFNFNDGYVVTAPVGRFKPNAFGLRDMLGNVWEWCGDWYGAYPTAQVDDPTGPAAGSFRVIRGGGWFSVAGDCRSAFRSGLTPAIRFADLGFRLAFSSVDQFGQ